MADHLRFEIGTPVIVDQCSDPDAEYGERHYPHAALHPDGTIYAHYDIAPWTRRPMQAVSRISSDGGATWSFSRPMPAGAPMQPAMMPSGKIVYINRLEYKSPGLIRATRCETVDCGENWSVFENTEVRYPKTIAVNPSSPRSHWGQCENFIYQYGFLVEGSSALWGLFGAHCIDKPWIRLMLFLSRDEGRTFEYVSTVGGADNPGHGGFSEPAISRMTDGSLLVISRTEYPPDDWRYLAQIRSTDNGKTWTSPVIPPGVPPVYRIRRQRPIANEGKIYASAGNVSPSLCILKNGVAALAFGRPGLKVVFSPDGTGSLWKDALRVVPESSLFGTNDDTSAMTGLIPLNDDTLLLVYDILGYRSGPDGPEVNAVFALPIRVIRG